LVTKHINSFRSSSAEYIYTTQILLFLCKNAPTISWSLRKEKQMENGRLQRETPLAFTYYELYRDLPAAERSLRVLADQEVNGKKRSVGMLGRWSTKYNWQSRVQLYDAQAAHDAYLDQAKRRQAEITQFIDEDMNIAIKFQRLCKSSLEELEQSGKKRDCKMLRQIALAYKESREWLKELAGILQDEEVEDGEEAEETEEGSFS
jgi:hypothetical protein